MNRFARQQLFSCYHSHGIFMKVFLNCSLLVLTTALLAGCTPQPNGEWQGYVEGEYVYVAAPLGGTLTQLAVARGDEVKAGQMLFELERGSEAAALDEAGKNLAQARANLALSETNYARRQQLRDGPNGVISAEELDQSRTQNNADAAQVAAQQAALDRAKWAFDQKRQFAPANAFVQDTLYRIGEYVAAGNPVVVLLPPENLKVRFFVPQEVLPKIKTGETVKVHFDGGAHSYTAAISYISTQVEFTPPVIYNRENRARLVFMVEAKFSPADAADLRPGQPVDVKISP
jgi:HlyD family secretion protein